MSIFIIEKNVPLTKKEGVGRPSKGYKTLLETMQVGDSVVIDKKAYQSIHNYAKQLGVTVKTRKVDDSTRRVWMVAK
jgi:hypothetical protein